MTIALDRPLTLDSIRDGDHHHWSASADEGAALAQRLGLASIERLEAEVRLTRDGVRITASGRVRALLTQSCVATGEPIPARVDEPFALHFVPDPGARAADEEYELGADDLDQIFHDGATIDVASAIGDTLALALDPYPRSPAADAALRAAGVRREEEMSPFAALGALRDRLKP